MWWLFQLQASQHLVPMCPAAGGMLKLSYSTAFTVSMLSWAYYEFKAGYKTASSVDFGANTIRWGADYLLKAAALNITSGGVASAPIFVAQVRTRMASRFTVLLLLHTCAGMCRVTVHHTCSQTCC
eukprot:GHRQ01032889.1.p1 GENE.GHRQ01032889.1~~GHRQ01032889.1.p1  ORF type:complete len:126 (+),score=30.02 GHRQ01032889.1:536-913(+)